MASFQQSEELIDDRIASLRSELENYGQDVLNLVQAIYGNHTLQSSVKYDLKNSPFQMIHLLKQEVIEMVKQSQEQSSYFQQHQQSLSYCQQLTDILSLITTIIDHIQLFETYLRELKLLACYQQLQAISEEIDKLPHNHHDSKNASSSSFSSSVSMSLIGAGKVCASLRNEQKLLRGRFIAKLRRLLSEAIVCDYGSIVVHKQLSGYLRSEDKVVEEPVTLADIWKSVLAVECTHQVLDAQLTDIWSLVMIPMWKEKKSQSPNVTTSQDRAEFTLGSVARGISDWSHVDIDARARNEGVWSLGSSKLPLPSLFEHIGHLFSFLYSEVFSADNSICILVGQKLADEPFKLAQQLTEVISNHIPKSESDLANFKRTLEEPVKALEWKIDTYFKISKTSGVMALSSTSSSSSSRGTTGTEFLSSHLSNMQSTFSSIRRKEILKHARDLVLLDYHNTMIASGDALEDELSSAGDIGDPRALLDQSGSFAIQKLKFDSCQVSLASCRLLKFVHDVMTQASHASTGDVANILFHSARDCLEIFTAIVPVKFAEVIETIPRMGAVFYNDCLYLAHNTVLLTHKYRLEISSQGATASNSGDDGLQGSIGFIDFIPRLRKLGDQCMQHHLVQQLATIKTMVEDIKITPDREQQSQSSSSSSAINSDNLIKGGLQLAGKLRSKFLKVSANIDVDETKVGRIDLKKLEDDANDDNRANNLVAHLEGLSTQWLGVLQEGPYGRFMGLLIDEMLKMVMAPMLHTDCITETACGEITRVFKTILRTRALLPADDSSTGASIRNICPSWTKFSALTELLEFNLNDIADGLSRKKFSDFTSTDITSLIKALFEDTPRRQSLLQSILDMNS